MTTAINRRRAGRTFTRMSALCLLALAAVLFQSREARAQWVTSGSNTTTTNSVGIGTATPSQMFHVHSGGTWAGTRVTTAATGTTINDGVHFGYDEAYGAYIWNREATSVVFSTSNIERMRVGPAGNVGIGTNTPGILNGVNLAGNLPLHVRGQGTNPASVVVDSSSPISGFVINDGSQPLDSRMWSISQAAGGGKLTFRTYSDTGVVASDKLVIDRTGNVGVGTSSPGSQLHVEASDAGAFSPPALGGSRLIIQNNNQTNGTYSDISFRTLDSSGFGQTAARITGIFTNHAYGGVSGDLAITTMNTMTRNEVARFTSSGNVGIGTNAPAAKLHVAGDVRIDGNISAKYQDVAEWVPSAEKLSAGTVVILDPERSNQVLASTTSYDTSVAGVISAQPGISLGEAGEGKVLVATTGRVKVKVDATRAPIKVGDLLVTSGQPGVAMKSQPLELGGVPIHRPGTLIGKALEPLAGGTGEILVLLSLQ